MGLIYIMDYLNLKVSIVIKTNFLCIIKMWKNRMTEYSTVSYWETWKTQKMTLSVVVKHIRILIYVDITRVYGEKI